MILSEYLEHSIRVINLLVTSVCYMKRESSEKRVSNLGSESFPPPTNGRVESFSNAPIGIENV